MTTTTTTTTTSADMLHISENWSFCYMDVGNVEEEEEHILLAKKANKEVNKVVNKINKATTMTAKVVHDSKEYGNDNFTDRVALTLCWQCWSGLQLFCSGCQRF